MIVIIHGPPSSGKTRNAKALLQRFGCKRLLDETIVTPELFKTIQDGDLILTQTDPGEWYRNRYISILPIEKAIGMLDAPQA